MDLGDHRGIPALATDQGEGMTKRTPGPDDIAMALVARAVADIGDGFGSEAKVTLVVRIGGREGDATIWTDDDLAGVAATLLDFEARAGKAGAH